MKYWMKCAAAAAVVGLVAYNGGRLSAHVGRHDALGLHQRVSLAVAPSHGDTPAVTIDTVVKTTGADRFWATGLTGDGVDVAVIDSGVTPVGALAESGKVVYGPDFSGSAGDTATANLDIVGHGTHMAGIIAGDDPVTGYEGVAPDARIVSLKVADPDGTTDVARVLQAITWVVDHKDDAGMHIRVLNLSLGGVAGKSYDKSVLSAAVERAWQAGITVVAAAGNDGKASKQLSDPAFDPYVVAVGAVDTNGTATTADDSVASFSSSGSAKRIPDLVAPGVRVQGVRVPGSLVDAEAPSATDSPFVNGSGTSQATAVVSGAAALILEQHPEYTPDRVKQALVSSAVKLRSHGESDQGQMELQIGSLADNATSAGKTRTQTWKQSKISDSQLAEANAAAAGTTVEPDGVRWSGVRWSGVRWSGVRWSGVRWSGVRWSGGSWD